MTEFHNELLDFTMSVDDEVSIDCDLLHGLVLSFNKSCCQSLKRRRQRLHSICLV